MPPSAAPTSPRYRAFGIRHITSFATYLDADYMKLHGDPQPALDEYGAAFVR